MQQLAQAIEKIAHYVESLEKKAVAEAEASPAPETSPEVDVEQVSDEATRTYGDLLPKLAARLDREEVILKTQLDSLSEDVIDALRKLADEEGSESISLGDVTNYDDAVKKASNTLSSNDAWSSFKKFVLS